MAHNTGILDQVRNGAVKPLYAVAGATDIAVEAARSYVADAQRSYAKGDLQPAVLQSRARALATERVDAAGELGKDAQARIEAYVTETIAEMEKGYDDLTKRGKQLVLRLRRQQATQDAVAAAETTVAKAKTTRTQTAKSASAGARTTRTAAKKTASTAKRNVKATRTSARKTAASSARAVKDGSAKVGN